MTSHSFTEIEQITEKSTIFNMNGGLQSNKPAYLYAEVNPQGSLNIIVIEFSGFDQDKQPPLSLIPSIQSIGIYTYRSDRDLPSGLFLMRSIQKVYSYLNSEKERSLRMRHKSKNGVARMVVEMKVFVTKNIEEYVKFQLDSIQTSKFELFASSRVRIFERISEAAKLEHLKLVQEKRKIQQEKILEEQAPTRKDNSQISEGEINDVEFLYDPTNEHHEPLSNQFPGNLEKIMEQDNSNTEKELAQKESPSTFQNDTFSQDSDLQNEQMAVLKEQNGKLLTRVIQLQTQLIKKSIRLEAYEDENLGEAKRMPKTQISKLEQKYENNVRVNIQTIQNLRNHFISLKSLLISEDRNSSNQNQQLQHQKRQSQTFNSIFDQIEEIFDSV